MLYSATITVHVFCRDNASFRSKLSEQKFIEWLI